MSAIRVAVVEDHALTRAGLVTALETGGMEVVAQSADGSLASAVVLEAAPDVAVIDIGLPGRDGIAVTREIKAASSIGIVIVTMHELEDEVFAGLAAGADAYCVKSSDPSVVLQAVHSVASGAAYFDPKIAHVVLRRLGSGKRPKAASNLTPRELEVLELLACGAINADIATSLHLGVGTVKGHVRDIIEKLSATDRTQAAVIAYRRGIIA